MLSHMLSASFLPTQANPNRASCLVDQIFDGHGFSLLKNVQRSIAISSGAMRNYSFQQKPKADRTFPLTTFTTISCTKLPCKEL